MARMTNAQRQAETQRLREQQELKIADAINTLIAEAVAKEREACAKLCEDRWQYGTATDCSQAIRARGQK